jgi:translation elongation factor EF-G
MARVVNGQYEHDETDISVRVVVPQEFLGTAIGTVNGCRGYIKALDAEDASHSTMAIRAFLPLVEYDSLVKLLHESAIPGLRVEREV